MKELQEIYSGDIKPKVIDIIEGDNSKVYYQARRLFGTWEEALKQAGIPEDVIKETRRQLNRGNKWTRETVITALKERYRGNKGLRVTDLKADGELGLYDGAKRRFGIWKNALKEAGIPDNYNKQFK